MRAKIITIKRTKDLNYFSLCALNLFNTRVSQFDQSLSFVSCLNCSYIRYCGERCQKDAWERWHQWECPTGADLLGKYLQKISNDHLFGSLCVS
uniref:MYND-type domain-containing protein n=1 Tax=Sinocyclocheilus grahami TaxID=75366 RepID=A0A672PJK5_SINGR